MQIDGNVGVFAINMTACGVASLSDSEMLALVKQGYFDGYKYFGAQPTIIELDRFAKQRSITYENEKIIPVPYDTIGNYDKYVYEPDKYELTLSEISYSLNCPKEFNVRFGQVQEGINDNIT